MDDLDIQIYEEDIASATYTIKMYEQKISDTLMTVFDEPENEQRDKFVEKLNQKVSQLKTKNRKLKAIVKEWYKQQND
jgi:hypothetical protein